MNNNLIIYYNGKDIFKDIAPTPFVSISQDYIDFSNKTNQITNLTLDGQITGKNSKFNNLYNYKSSLLNDLKNNFKELKIVENGTEIYKANVAVVNSISFPENKWYGLLPFNIEFTVYDSGLFQESYGVINPEENFEFQEENGDFLTFTHSLSAQGIQTLNQNAIENAKEWVNSRTGQFNKILPIFCKNNTNDFLLQTVSEEVDRFNGNYSHVGVYKKNVNIESPKSAFLQYTVDVTSGINDGLIVSNINGTLNGNTIDTIRTEFNNINYYNLCNTLTRNIFNVDLNNKAISQLVEESPNENSLNFNFTYNNDYLPNIINDYTVTTITDPLKCITESEISAKIFGRYGDNSTKWPLVLNYYTKEFFPYSLVLVEYNKDAPTNSNPLNSTPINESISFNEYNAEINYRAKFSNKTRSFNAQILSMSSTVSYSPSLEIYVANPAAAVPRAHNVQNLLCANRSVCKISVTAIGQIDTSITFVKDEVSKEINRLKNLYVDQNTSLEEEYDISITDSIKSVTINGSWSFEGKI